MVISQNGELGRSVVKPVKTELRFAFVAAPIRHQLSAEEIAWDPQMKREHAMTVLAQVGFLCQAGLLLERRFCYCFQRVEGRGKNVAHLKNRIFLT